MSVKNAVGAGMQENKFVKGEKMAEHRELTNKEMEILIVMFKNMYEVINVCGGNIDVHGSSFGVNDLFCLAEKLGVVEEY